MDFTEYDRKPEAMINYLRYNGAHFSQKLCEFAVDKMKKKDASGKKVGITPYEKEDVDELLKAQGIELEDAQLHDAVFVANMAKADYLGRSIADAAHLALFIKDYIDDPDGYEGLPFNRWYADMCRKGIAIPWEEVV